MENWLAVKVIHTILQTTISPSETSRLGSLAKQSFPGEDCACDFGVITYFTGKVSACITEV